MTPDDDSTSDDLAQGALDAIHALLDDGGIPRGTFADDHVRNLVALYNRRGAAMQKVIDAAGGPKATWFTRYLHHALSSPKRPEPATPSSDG